MMRLYLEVFLLLLVVVEAWNLADAHLEGAVPERHDAEVLSRTDSLEGHGAPLSHLCSLVLGV